MRLLRRRPEVENRPLRRPHLRVQREHEPVVRASVAERFHGIRGRLGIEGAPTVFLREAEALDAERGALHPLRAGEHTIAVAGRHIVGQARGERDRLLPHLFLCCRPREVHEVTRQRRRARFR